MPVEKLQPNEIAATDNTELEMFLRAGSADQELILAAVIIIVVFCYC